MAQVSTVDLVKEDQEHLFHPLHHPADHQSPKVWVKGEGIYLWDAEGRQYIDGLAKLAHSCRDEPKDGDKRKCHDTHGDHDFHQGKPSGARHAGGE